MKRGRENIFSKVGKEDAPFKLEIVEGSPELRNGTGQFISKPDSPEDTAEFISILVKDKNSFCGNYLLDREATDNVKDELTHLITDRQQGAKCTVTNVSDNPNMVHIEIIHNEDV